jgi:hypothetical protein
MIFFIYSGFIINLIDVGGKHLPKKNAINGGALLYRKLIHTAYSLEVIKRMAKQFKIINYLIMINDNDDK